MKIDEKLKKKLKFIFKILIAIFSVVLPLYLALVANDIATYSAPLEYDYQDSGIFINPAEGNHPSISFDTVGDFLFTEGEIVDSKRISTIYNISNINVTKGTIKDVQYYILNTTDEKGEELSCAANEFRLYTLMTLEERMKRGCYFTPITDSEPYSLTSIKVTYTPPKFQMDFFDIFVLITDKDNNHYIDFVRVFAGTNVIRVTEKNNDFVSNKCKNNQMVENSMNPCLLRRGFKIYLKESHMIDGTKIRNANESILKFVDSFYFESNAILPKKQATIDPITINNQKIKLIELLEEIKLY